MRERPRTSGKPSLSTLQQATCALWDHFGRCSGHPRPSLSRGEAPSGADNGTCGHAFDAHDPLLSQSPSTLSQLSSSVRIQPLTTLILSHNSHPLSEFSLSQPSHNSRPLPQPFMSQLHTRFDDLFRRKRTSHRRSWVARVPTNPLGDALEQTRQHPSLATVALFAFLPLIRGKQALPRWNGCSSTCEYNAFILVHLCHDVHAGAKNASNRSSHGSICQGMFRLLQGLLSLSVLDNLCTASSFLLCGTCNSIEILPT